MVSKNSFVAHLMLNCGLVFFMVPFNTNPRCRLFPFLPKVNCCLFACFFLCGYKYQLFVVERKFAVVLEKHSLD